MKKIKFFVMALAALTVFSCSKEQITGEDDGVMPGTGQPTYATFTFNTESTKGLSRAGNENDALSDETKEKVVGKLRILIFSTDAGESLEVNQELTPAEVAAKSATLLVKAGTKRIFIVANETGGADGMKKQFDDLKVGTANLTNFLALKFDAGEPGAAFSLASLYNVSPTEGMPMSSSNEKSIKILKPNISAAQAQTDNKFDFALDYMLAKVGVKYNDATVASNDLLTVEDMKFAVRNLAEETYLTQQFVNGNVAGVYYTWLPTTITSTDKINGWGKHYDIAAAPNIAVTATAPAKGAFAYASENTKDALTLLSGGTTYAALQCVVTPKKVFDGTGMAWDPLAGKLNLGTAKAGVKGVTFIVTAKEFDFIPAGTVFNSLATFNKARAMAEFKDKYTNQAPSKSVTEKTDYVTHTNGVTWYRINIADTEKVTNKLLYGIVRGKQYTATINSIKSFGSGSDDVGPEVPVEQNTYINVTISVKGWSTAGSSTDL